MAISSLLNQVNISEIYVAVGKPTAANAYNQFDELGELVGVKRLLKENNATYKRRITDAYVNRSNSTYRGLINGITRELGLSLYNPVTITPKKSLVTGEVWAPEPYILFDGIWLYLYSDYTNNIYHVVDRYEPGGNFEHLSSLASYINSTTYFEMEVKPGYEYTSSMVIFNQSSRSKIEHPVDQSTKFKLQKSDIALNTVYFSDRSVFRTEVASEALVTSAGKYYINYETGVVKTYSEPKLENTVRYEYSTFPFKPIATDIILHDINNDNFKVKMFNQITNETGTAHGTPTIIGTDIINELLSVVPMYWGV